MNARKVAFVAAVLGAIGGVTYTLAPASVAQGIGGAPAPLAEVKVAQPIDTNANITNTYVPVGMDPGAPRLSAEVTGVSGGSVVTSGTVSISGPVTLTSATNALLAGIRPCAAVPIGHNTVDGGAYFEFVSAPGQTAISITAHTFDDVDNVCCFLGVADGGPYPNCAEGAAGVCDPIHNQGSLVQDGLTDASRMRCLACKHTPGPSVGTARIGGQISVCTPF